MTGKPSEEMKWTRFHPDTSKSIVYPEVPVLDLLKEENKNRKDYIALEYNDTEITYGQLFDSIDHLSSIIKTKIQPCSIVTIPTIPTPDLVLLFYALSDNRVISDMIDPRISLDGIKKYLMNYKKEEESHYLFTLNLLNKKMNQLLGNSSIEKIVNFSLTDHSTKTPLPIKILSNLKDSERKRKYPDNITMDEFSNIKGTLDNSKIPEFNNETPVTIIHTGGTTGDPKGVLLSHYGLNAAAWNIKHSGIDLQPKDKFLHYMPLFIAYGLTMVHMSLLMGMRVCMISPFNPKKMDSILFKHKAQHFAGVPNHIMKLKNSKLVKKEGLSFLKTPTVGGDGIDAGVHKEFSEFVLSKGAQHGICPGYSLTEANSVGTVNLGQLNKYGCAGYPLPGIRFGVFDEEQNELDYNQKGEICILTPSRMLGYHNNQEETDIILRKHNDGNVWIHTGDIGEIDNDGFVHVVGRIKDMIIRHDGFKIFPKVVEEAIGTHPHVDECRVVGIRDKGYSQGYLAKAHIILRKGSTKTSHILHEIKAICSDLLPEYMMPIDYKFRDDFPRTLLGKVDTIALKNEEN